MKNRAKKLIAVLMALTLSLSCFSVVAFAADDDEDLTGFGVKDMSYEMAVVAVPAMNKVFNAANLLAGATESWSSSDGETYTDVAYGSRECQKYDMYIPANLDKSQPQGVVICIHGGTWTMGDKEGMAWAAERFAKAGYIGVTIDYDLASQGNDNVAKVTGSKSNANVYDMEEDVLEVLASVKKEAAALGYDVESAALIGESAGSNIAALVAYGHAEESAIPIKCLFPVTLPAGFHEGDFDNYTDEEVAGYASIVSGETLTAEDISNPDARAQKILDSISPDAQVTANSCPTLLGFAGKDTTIGTNQYNAIQPQLEKYGVTYDTIWWPNSNHTLESDPGVIDTYTDTAIEWLGKYMPAGISEVDSAETEETNDVLATVTATVTATETATATEEAETTAATSAKKATSKASGINTSDNTAIAATVAVAAVSGAAFVVFRKKANK